MVEVEKNLGEISLDEARKIYGKDVEIGQYVPKTMAMYEFEPKLIKTAQKAIQDKIHQLEEEKVRNDFDKQKIPLSVVKLNLLMIMETIELILVILMLSCP